MTALHARLLLVEDDDSMRRALQLALERRGFEVTCCSNGLDALRALKHTPPDLALLDLTIPGIDGLAVLQKARTQGVSTPILVLTARGAVGDRIQGLNAGADDYLAKPFDLDELEARIRALLRRAKGDGEVTHQCGRLRLERDSGAFYLGDEVLELTPANMPCSRPSSRGRATRWRRSGSSVWCSRWRPTSSSRPSRWSPTGCAKSWPARACRW